MFEELSRLHNLCFPNKPWSADEFAALQKSGAEIIASERGFIVWRRAADPSPDGAEAGECEIITIGVHPEHRGIGIGDAMMALMEKEILKKMYGSVPAARTKIFLEAAADNAAAIALYKKHGFRQIAVRPKYYDGKDAIVMEKILSNKNQLSP
ncbi:MAG: GNAT family N-acetyltransferase [Proteobacteria bacterium]|nr:GNAT family N-acetyltransferase [Pseudomonadota bacterium]